MRHEDEIRADLEKYGIECEVASRDPECTMSRGLVWLLMELAENLAAQRDYCCLRYAKEFADHMGSYEWNALELEDGDIVALQEMFVKSAQDAVSP